jgi:hypothetical protein
VVRGCGTRSYCRVLPRGIGEAMTDAPNDPVEYGDDDDEDATDVEDSDPKDHEAPRNDG